MLWELLKLFQIISKYSTELAATALRMTAYDDCSYYLPFQALTVGAKTGGDDCSFLCERHPVSSNYGN